LAEALRLFDMAQYDTAEGLLVHVLDRPPEDLASSDPAAMRVALAIVLKYKGEFTRAFAELEAVLADPIASAEVRRHAYVAVISLNLELGRYDRVEELAAEAPAGLAPLTFVALARLKGKRTEDGYVTIAREIEAAERAGDSVRALTRRAQLALWRVLPYLDPPRREPMTADMLADTVNTFDACERDLVRLGTDAALSAASGLRQWRGVLLWAGGQFPKSELEFRRAIETADKTGSAETRARTRQALILMLLERAERGDIAAATEASALVDELFALLINVETPGSLARAAYVAALIDRRLGRFTGDVRYLRSAVSWLQQADRWLSSMRGRYREPGIETTDTTRRAMHASVGDICVLAVQISLKDLRRPSDAFEWAERYKAAVLAETIGTAALHTPAELAKADVEREQELLVQLDAATSYAEVWHVCAQLDSLWEQWMSKPAASEYVALRRGLPTRYAEIRRMLADADSEAER
jgi:tetratricopeptide (TPR) repeat protein